MGDNRSWKGLSGHDSRSQCDANNNEPKEMTVEQTFAASDAIVDNTMENVEKLLRPIRSDPKNRVVNNLCSLPDQAFERTEEIKDGTESTNIQTARLSAMSSNSGSENGVDACRSSLEGRMRSISAPGPRSLAKGIAKGWPRLMFPGEKHTEMAQLHSRRSLKLTGEIQAQEKQIQAMSNLTGPIRVETSRKTSRQPNADIVIEDRIELTGRGVRGKPVGQLVEVKPVVRQYGAQLPKHMRPVSKQSVKIAKNSIIIERTSTLKQLPQRGDQKSRVEEKRVFHCGEWPHCKDVPKSGVKSDSWLAKRRELNLQGPLQVVSTQQMIAGKHGEYTVVEDIELRADGSVDQPKEELKPFKRKSGQSEPQHGKKKSLCKFDERIRIGQNVVLIERDITVFPTKTALNRVFSVSDVRSYTTDKTVESKKAPPPRQRYYNPNAMSPADFTAKSPTYRTARSTRSKGAFSPMALSDRNRKMASTCETNDRTGGTLKEPKEQADKQRNRNSPPQGERTRTARSPSGRSPTRKTSPRVDPLTPQRSPPRVMSNRKRKSRDRHGADEQTACSPGSETERNVAMKDKDQLKPTLLQRLSDLERNKDKSQIVTQSSVATCEEVSIQPEEPIGQKCSAEFAHRDLQDADERSQREAKIVRSIGRKRSDNTIECTLPDEGKPPSVLTSEKADKSSSEKRSDSDTRTAKSFSAESLPPPSISNSARLKRSMSAEATSTPIRMKMSESCIPMTTRDALNKGPPFGAESELGGTRMIAPMTLMTGRGKSETSLRQSASNKLFPHSPLSRKPELQGSEELVRTAREGSDADVLSKGRKRFGKPSQTAKEKTAPHVKISEGTNNWNALETRRRRNEPRGLNNSRKNSATQWLRRGRQKTSNNEGATSQASVRSYASALEQCSNKARQANETKEPLPILSMRKDMQTAREISSDVMRNAHGYRDDLSTARVIPTARAPRTNQTRGTNAGKQGESSTRNSWLSHEAQIKRSIDNESMDALASSCCSNPSSPPTLRAFTRSRSISPLVNATQRSSSSSSMETTQTSKSQSTASKSHLFDNWKEPHDLQQSISNRTEALGTTPNSPSTILIESTGVYNLVMTLRIRMRVETKSKLGDDASHGLRTSSVFVGGRKVYGD